MYVCIIIIISTLRSFACKKVPNTHGHCFLFSATVGILSHEVIDSSPRLYVLVKQSGSSGGEPARTANYIPDSSLLGHPTGRHPRIRRRRRLPSP